MEAVKEKKVWWHVFLVMTFVFIPGGQLMLTLGRTDGLGSEAGWIAILIAGILIALCYINLYILVPRMMLKEKYAKYFTALSGGILAYVVIKWGLERYLLAKEGVAVEFNEVTMLDWMANFFMYGIAVISPAAIVMFKQWIADTKKIDDLENNRLQSRVDKIKNSIDAPVLYRVLGYAAKKVKTDPEKASAIILRLSEKLRRELYENGR